MPSVLPFNGLANNPSHIRAKARLPKLSISDRFIITRSLLASLSGLRLAPKPNALTLSSPPSAVGATRGVFPELRFYEDAREGLSTGEYLGARLVDWMPSFWGTLTAGVTPQAHALHAKGVAALELAPLTPPGDPYLVLGNGLHGIRHPSVMDIKLGSVLYDETASAQKRTRMLEVSRTTTSGSLGFRVCGMKCYAPGGTARAISGVDTACCVAHDDYLTFDKTYGRLLTANTAYDGVAQFFALNKQLPQQVRQAVQTSFHNRLQVLYNCLLDEEIRVVGGSLLFIYENDASRWEELEFQDPLIYEETGGSDDDSEDEGVEHEDAPLSRLLFIDFAHATRVPGQGPDEELLKGVESLLAVFERMTNEPA